MQKAAIQRVLSSNSHLWRNAASFSTNSTSISHKNKDHIGIDIGSSSIKVAIMECNNQPKLIHKQPSVLSIDFDGKNFQLDNIFGFKNLVSKGYNDPLVRKEIEKATYNKIYEAPNGDALIGSLNGLVVVHPTGLYQNLLTQVKTNAEKCLGKTVSRAVIANPMCFSKDQLKDVVNAGLRAGFELIHSIDEPTAAGIAYGMNGKEEGRCFVVIDIGARTFDVSIFEVGSNGRFSFKKPTKSDMFFGGNDFDLVIAEYIKRGMDCSDECRKSLNPKDFAGFSESRKIELSSSFETTIMLPYFKPNGEFFRYFMNEKLTRTKFESMVNHLIQKIKNQIENCLIEAGISAKDVDEVLLVGGMARVPKVRKVVNAIFGKIPNKSLTNPDEAVALGAAAAVQAGHFGSDAWNDQ